VQETGSDLTKPPPFTMVLNWMAKLEQ